MADLRRFDVGFQAGGSVTVRAEADVYDSLVASLAGDGEERWHTFESDDSHIVIDLSQVAYVRRERGDQRVGF